MEAHGVEKLLGPLPVTDGPAAGQTINYFRAPFGTYIELISYPNGMAYEATRASRSGRRSGTACARSRRACPACSGIDHVGITVPDIDAAVAWFEDVLGCIAPLTFGPFSDPRGTFMQDLLGGTRARSSSRSRWSAAATAPTSSCSGTPHPTRTGRFRKNSDFGGKHIAFYVRHIDKAVAYLQAQGREKLLGPLPGHRGPGGRPDDQLLPRPFGTYIELISYPKGMAYEETAPDPLWDPRDNHP